MDVYAPGEGVLSTWSSSDRNLAFSTGTSMAAPHATGVKALYLARKYHSPADLDAILKDVATKNAINQMPKGNFNYLLYSPKSTEDQSFAVE